jgi:SAM-dependent methyltransferase
MRILDAGCGRGFNPVEIGEDTYIVGIDVSEDALAANTSVDERLIGDLQTYPLPVESFDMAVCWEVLEHLPRPVDALDNLVGAIKPGGRLVVGVPNVFSPKALVAKFTPHSFHIWVYKHVFKFSFAGKPGYGPYRTYLRWNLSPHGLVRYAASRGLDVAEIEQYETDDIPAIRRFWETHPRFTKALTAIWKVVFSGVEPRNSEVRIVLVKPGLVLQPSDHRESVSASV